MNWLPSPHELAALLMAGRVRGVIVVMDDGCMFQAEYHHGENSWGQSGGIYDAPLTVEKVNDAARVLNSALDVSFENVAKECQRVHARDQQRAHIREMVERLTNGKADNRDGGV